MTIELLLQRSVNDGVCLYVCMHITVMCFIIIITLGKSLPAID